MILLDTCAAIWFAAGDKSLQSAARKLIESAGSRGELFVSPITAWEISTLARRGRLTIGVSPRAFVERIFRQPGAIEVTLDRDVLFEAGALTDCFHGDPADRFIVATAIVKGFRLMTRDARILAYSKKNRTLATIAC